MTASLLAFTVLAAAQNPLMSGWEAQSGFKALFDGKSTQGWKGWKQEKVPPAWQAENGELIVKPGRGDGGDICSQGLYADFDFRLEWKATKGANSGIIYRAAEDYEASWQTGPEYQIFDDIAYGGTVNKNSAGSLYDVYTPTAYVTRPAGEWNESRIVVKGNHIQHWLNQVKVVDCVVGSDDWKAHCGPSKFKAFPLFATKSKGFLVLQDHGYEVAFRRVRVKEL